MAVLSNFAKKTYDKNKGISPETNESFNPITPVNNMAKILLLDFEEKDYKFFKDKDFDVDRKETNWKSSSIESLMIPDDCRLILYQANNKSTISSAHARDSEKFKNVIKRGGAVVCFIGKCETFHLTNFIGSIPKFEFIKNETPNLVTPINADPYAEIFEKFGKSITEAKKLFPDAMAAGAKVDLKSWDPHSEGELQILATSSDGYPISAVIRNGKGYYLFLPWFGDENIRVVEYILTEMYPKLEIVEPEIPEMPEEPKAATSDAVSNWLDKEEYAFPGLQELYKEKEEARKKFERAITKIDAKIEELKDKKQAPFQKTLISNGEELVTSVITALEYIGWKKVVNVNEYWKNVVRDKEEDIWLLEDDTGPIEETIKTGYVFLINVAAGTESAKAEDCSSLQKFKGRRMQEFNNTKMKSILIGNYFYDQEAALRKNPFSEEQISDVEKDGNGVLTTYELFKAVKGIMENKIKKEEIQKQMQAQTGLIQFNLSVKK
ncbi:MAG: hypothetical protein PVI66_14565 [Candidatus Aminicenantes bacterium]